ncbi:AAA family ATPase [Novipirellula rosea]|uniref:AAA domain-containing protein n=1 Tax=Novipirellula rosea TaxID=1031540 RepID=A0ABP8NXN5_9BACT
MISGIAIENFKGVREKIELELRPITLLFGPNSAGKSTITDALDYFEALLITRSASLGNLSSRKAGDNNKELSFERLIHNHDLYRTMRLGVECELTCEDEGYMSVKGTSNTNSSEDWGLPTSYDLNFADDLRTLEIEFEIKGTIAHFDGGLINSAEISRFVVKYNDELLAAVQPIHETSGRLNGFRWTVDLANPLIPIDLEQSGIIEFDNYHFQLIPVEHDPPLTGGLYKASVAGQEIPNAAVANYLNALLLGAFRIMGHRLRQRKTIAGIRAVPDRNSIPMPADSPSRWNNGLAAWDYLAYCGEDSLNEVNLWLGSKHLGTGYQLKQRKLVDLNECFGIVRAITKNNDSDSAQAFLKLQSGAERRVGFVPGDNPYLRNGPFLHPSDVGTGLSQIVPVLVASSDPKPSFISIAQPDLHLHPRLQAELSDVFVQAINRAEAPRFLLETHSEHLILRLLRRIRETAIGEAPEGCELRTEELGIYFVSQENGATKIEMIEADIRGEFIQPWPDDFFELDFHERFG